MSATLTEHTAAIGTDAGGPLMRVDHPAPVDLNQTLELARVFVQSGYFDGVKSISQAAVKIMAGREFGFGPFASMQGIYIVGGRPALMAQLLAAKIMRSGYDYRVRELSDDQCTIDFFRSGEKIGSETFTQKDAKRQGTKNMEKFPRNMLFARAMSNGVRFYCAGAFGGAAVYTPEDLGMEQRADGTYDEGVARGDDRLGEVATKAPAADTPQTAALADEVVAEIEASTDRMKAVAPGLDESKTYHIDEVAAASKKGGPFSLKLREGGVTLRCSEAKLYIVAVSAKQSGAQVIVRSRRDGDDLILTDLSEMEDRP